MKRWVRAGLVVALATTSVIASAGAADAVQAVGLVPITPRIVGGSGGRVQVFALVQLPARPRSYVAQVGSPSIGVTLGRAGSVTVS